MSSSRLDLSERYCLHALYETGMSMRAIADALERAPSTISRELRRNQHATRYRPDHAQRISEHRRTQASRRPRIDAEDRAAALPSSAQDTWIQNAPRSLLRGGPQQRCESELNSPID